MKKTIFVVLAFILIGCPKPSPVVHHPTNDTADCPAACQHLRDLKCEEGNPLADGTTCETFCQNTQTSGHALTPSCVVNIKKCSDMDNVDAFCPKANAQPK